MLNNLKFGFFRGLCFLHEYTQCHAFFQMQNNEKQYATAEYRERV
jgi:hypothetical protein